MITKGSNLYLTRGDTASITYEIEFEENVLIEAFYFTVKKNSLKRGEGLINKSWTGVNNDVELKIPDPFTTATMNYKFIVSLTHEDTENLNFGSYKYDVQINYKYDGEEEPQRILTIVKPSVFEIMEEITDEGLIL